MRMLYLAVALMMASLAGTHSAEARRYDGGDDGARHYSRHTRHSYEGRRYKRDYSETRRHSRHASRSVGGRPRQWCGWWMRTQKGGGPEFNLAANWRRWGSSSGPQVGAVVVWPHHVGMITGRSSNGRWIVKSGNDGGAVRERARSVSGAVFRVG